MTTLDLGQLPWVLVIGNGSSLELRDLVIMNAAPRSAAANTSYDYVAGLPAWPSLGSQAGGQLVSDNATQFFWSSSVFRGDACDWQAPDAQVDAGRLVRAATARAALGAWLADAWQCECVAGFVNGCH